jgi:argininosuccinate lyase
MKLWAGRLGEQGGKAAIAFTGSFEFDKRFFAEDISASIAHAEMLGQRQIIESSEATAIVKGLEKLRNRVSAEGFPKDTEDEDIFSFVERELFQDIGEAAGKLHTARSRNDQVATDFRLYVKSSCRRLLDSVLLMREAIISLADQNYTVITAGFTHLQIAQPVLLGHHLLAWDCMFTRDTELIEATYRIADVLPLGAGAIGGVPYPIDPGSVAQRLGFSRIAENSMDAVSDRDFVSTYLFAATMISNHLSRIAEEICLWNSAQFATISIADSYATGSSIMPQKKNPDVAELARAKAARVLGTLTGFLATTKGLPLAYNLDLQEDKEAVFTAEDAILPALHAMAGLIKSLTIHPERMRLLASSNHSSATDLADYLVTQHKVPFRKAHEIVGGIVRNCEMQGINLADADLTTLQTGSTLFTEDSLERLDPMWSISTRNSPGGTAPELVKAALANARNKFNATKQKWAALPPKLP